MHSDPLARIGDGRVRSTLIKACVATLTIYTLGHREPFYADIAIPRASPR